MLENLLNSTIFVLFIIIALGFILGSIKVRGINLDVSAVIFVALLFGHYGVVIPDVLGTFGMVLFIFSIGFQAGPGFFRTFASRGKVLSLLAVILISTAAVLVIVGAHIFGFNAAEATGIFTGALTSTPGLATAREVAGADAAISYSIGYPFGVIGVILFVKLLPIILKVDLKRERALLDGAQERSPKVVAAQFLVQSSVVAGRSLVDLAIRKVTGATITRIVRGDQSFIPSGGDMLLIGDRLKVVGTVESLDKFEHLVGERVEGELPFIDNIVLTTALLTSKSLVGKSLGAINLQQVCGCSVSRVRRSGIDLLPDPDLRLNFGDKLTLVGPRERTNDALRLIGNKRNKISDTDFFPIAIGIVLGVLVGNLTIGFGSFSFSLGLTGGVLFVALLLSSIGKTGGIIWAMSSPANQLLRQLGLLLFLASVGTSAGGTLVETFSSSGLTIVLWGIVITVVPMIVTVIIARLFMKVNLLELLGLLTGGMTSTPGLAAAMSMSSSNSVSLAYATVYPVAMVLLIVFTQMISIFVQ